MPSNQVEYRQNENIIRMPQNTELLSWNVSPAEAIQQQQELRKLITLTKLHKKIQYIAGTDLSFNLDSDVSYAGIVILDYTTLQPVARSTAVSTITFPYVPGLLSFREIPSLMQAWQQLPLVPDVVLVDGHGIAHPRQMGIATHLGLIIQKPTLGCAKKILTGKYQMPAPEKGSYSPIISGPETLGYALRTKNKVKPVFISPGNLITLEESLEIALHCTVNHKLPEPTRLAHLTVNALRRGEIEAGAAEF